MEKNDFLLQLVENSTHGLLILDEARSIVFFNELFIRMTGLRASVILGDRETLLSSLLPDEIFSDKRLICLSGEGKDRFFYVSHFPLNNDGRNLTVLCLDEAESERETVSLQAPTTGDLFDNLDEPLLSCRPDGTVLRMNPAMLAALGYQKGEFPTNASSLYQDEGHFDRLISLTEKHGKTVLRAVALRKKDGSFLVLQESTWTHRSIGGECWAVTSHFHNAHRYYDARNKLKISERNYERLFEQIASSIIVVNETGCVVNCNSNFEELYGHPRIDIMGTDFDSRFLTDSERPSIREIVLLCLKNGYKHTDVGVPRVNADGGLFYTYATYTLVDDPRRQGLYLYVVEKDLTEFVELKEKVRESLGRIKNVQTAAITGFAKLTEFRDSVTGDHLERIRDYTAILARALRRERMYADYIDDDYIEDLALSSVLHDIGKVGIEDAILLKNGKLNDEEYARIKDHALLGGNALKAIAHQLEYDSFLTLGREIAYYHHERWNGEGYPCGLRGEEIPLSARIVAVADVYDALTSVRPYKPAYSHDDAVAIILAERERHFDPLIVDAFHRHHEDFRTIRQVKPDRETVPTDGTLLREQRA